MSRQSKNAQRIILAKAITALHLSGMRGPKQTTPKHGKNRLNRMLHDGVQSGSKQAHGDKESCATVCGKEVRIYGPAFSGVRKLYDVWLMPHHGAAIQEADAYNEVHK